MSKVRVERKPNEIAKLDRGSNKSVIETDMRTK